MRPPHEREVVGSIEIPLKLETNKQTKTMWSLGRLPSLTNFFPRIEDFHCNGFVFLLPLIIDDKYLEKQSY